jgi:hypothetical protein
VANYLPSLLREKLVLKKKGKSCDFGFWILRLKSRGRRAERDVSLDGSRPIGFSQDGFWIGNTFLCLDSIASSVVVIFKKVIWV